MKPVFVKFALQIFRNKYVLLINSTFRFLIKRETYTSMCPADTLLKFLEKSYAEREKLISNNCWKMPVEVVMGNEACDLDSAVSAILYAFYVHTVMGDSGTVVLPVLNTPIAQFPLKTEVIFVLAKLLLNNNYVNASVEDKIVKLETMLIFRDSIDLDKLYSMNKLRLRIVDHNALPQSMQHLQKCLVDIVDHHEVSCPAAINGIPNEIEPVGSCATLVFWKIYEHNPELLNHRICMLAYYAILTDTVNLNPEAKKTTPKDSRAIETLEARGLKCKRDLVFESVMRAKADVSSLNVHQLMDKDKKIVEIKDKGESCQVALSSIPLSFDKLLDHCQCQNTVLINQLNSYMQRDHLGALIILTFFQDEHMQFHRQILIAANTGLRELILSRLNKLDLGLLQVHMNETKDHEIKLTVFDQKNLAFGRKQVLPAILK